MYNEENTMTENEVMELQQEIIEVAKERRQQKVQAEEKRRLDEDWNNQVKDFKDKHSDVDLSELEADEKFLKFAKGRKGRLPDIYEAYLDYEDKGEKPTDKGEQKKPSPKKPQSHGLTEEQKKLCEKHGMSYSEYKERLAELDTDSTPKHTKLSDRQIKLCKASGMDPEEYLRLLNEI